MPVAAIADIHGNIQALEAVLADPRLTAAERIVVLGDVVAGTFPAETFDRVVGLGDRACVLRGNADRIVLEDDSEDARWVRERLGEDRLSALRSWPLSFAIEVEGLGAVRCCHATPASDEEIVTRVTPEPELEAALAGTEDAITIGGHTHVQFDRRMGSGRFVNVGSVGRPWERPPGAYWALLGSGVELVRTDYDVQAAAAAVLASGQPRSEEIADVLLHPPSAEEATAVQERRRGET